MPKALWTTVFFSGDHAKPTRGAQSLLSNLTPAWGTAFDPYEFTTTARSRSKFPTRPLPGQDRSYRSPTAKVSVGRMWESSPANSARSQQRVGYLAASKSSAHEAGTA